MERSLDDRALMETSESPAVARPSNTKRSIAWLQALAFVLGAALLVYVIRKVGVQPIFSALSRVGFGFFFVVAINGMRHVLRTIAMSLSVPPEHRRFTFLQAFAARLGGESMSFLTFAGPLLGEATKVAMLRKRVPLVHGVPALVVDNLLYNLSVVLVIFGGACLMLFAYPVPTVAREMLILIASIAFLGLIAAAMATRRRVTLLTNIIDRLGRRGFRPGFLRNRRHHIYRVELTVYSFYKRRRAAFFSMVGLDVTSHMASVVEVYVTLKMLGFVPSVGAAYIIESLTKVINFAFGFVPATIGVYEGGTEIILKSLGFAAAAGVTLAIVRKAAIIFWTVIGVFIITWRAVPNAWRRVLDRSPRLQKLMDSLVLSNLAHRPARTAVSVVGIALGVLLVVFTVGLAHGLLRERGKREANIGAQIMVRPAGMIALAGNQAFAMPVAHAAELLRVEGVRMAVPIGQNLDKSDSGFGSRLIEGVPFDQYAALNGLTIKEGRGLQSGDEVIIDSAWQRERNVAVGSTIDIYERPFRIVGIYEPPGGGRIKIPLATMQDQVGSEHRCNTILIACADPSQQEQVAALIKKQFPDDQIVLTRELPELYMSSVPALNIFLKVVVGVATTISMLVILLAMYTTVTERTRQIGILKSLGMSKRSIAWVIEQEAILVSVLGVLIGVLLTLLVRFFVMRSTTLVVDVEPKWIAISLVVGLIGGSIGALYPALRAARQDAVDALSYE
ncbi:MAG: putative transport system permease protein [Blastocatellia bacterium]|jgi:putative ABC transport system permease protein|nr:putative transport system permease protein [Blastocatellia bacterium]